MNDPLASQVERFADLMAHIDDPFAEPSAVLASSGLDDASYRSLVDGWRARFDRDESGSLAERFAGAYAAARAGGRREEPRSSAPENPIDPRFLNAAALAFREEAAKVALEPMPGDAPPPIALSPVILSAPVASAPEPPPPAIIAAPPVETYAEKRARFAGTMEIGHLVPRDAVPFVPAAGVQRPIDPPPAPAPPRVPTGTADISAFIPRDLLPFPGSPPPPAPPPPSAGDRPSPPFPGTADISAFIPRPATPFAAPPTAQAAPEAPPRKRLIRFDPQTGLPLPAPIWVDLPPEPDGGKR